MAACLHASFTVQIIYHIIWYHIVLIFLSLQAISLFRHICLQRGHRRLSHSCTLLKPFDGLACHLAGTFRAPVTHFVRWVLDSIGKREIWWSNPQPKYVVANFRCLLTSRKKAISPFTKLVQCSFVTRNCLSACPGSVCILLPRRARISRIVRPLRELNATSFHHSSFPGQCRLPLHQLNPSPRAGL